MNCTFRIFALAAATWLLMTVPSKQQRLEDQAVTWADFNYVNYAAASMSHVYFTTTQGIIRYNKLEKRWEDPLTGAVGLHPGELIRRIWVDTFDEKLYIETDQDRYEYNILFSSFQPIETIPEFRSDSRHVATPEGMFPPFGFNFMAGGSLIDPSGRNWQINDVLDDGNGTLWIGTWGYGAATAEASSRVIDLLPYGLLQNQVNTIYDDGTLLWVGGTVLNDQRTGLTAFDPKENTFTYVESGLNNNFPAADVRCLEGNGDAIYIGTDIGLMVYDRKDNRIADRLTRRNGLTDDEVTALLIVGDSLFVGTAAGLTLLDFAVDSVKYVYPTEFINRVIYDLEQLDSTLWIASESGAYRLLLTTNRLQKYQDPDLVLFSRIYNLERHGDDIWFASDGGVVRLDTKTGVSQSFSLESASFEPRALAVNDRVAAVSSDRGFTMVFLDDDKPYSREFTTDDGLPSENVNSLLFDGDYLWVGSDRGLTLFWWNNPNRVD